MARPVDLDAFPFNAQLHCWGRDREGWWGLIVWSVRLTYEGAPARLDCAGWVPAGRLRPPTWAVGGGAPVPRITLPGDRSAWPPPPELAGWFAGLWIEGGTPIPPGTRLVTALSPPSR